MVRRIGVVGLLSVVLGVGFIGVYRLYAGSREANAASLGAICAVQVSGAEGPQHRESAAESAIMRRRQSAEAAIKAAARMAHPLPPVRDVGGGAPLSYRGPGILEERADGIVLFVPGHEWLSSTVGFDLQWDPETIEAARAGEIPLVHIAGDLDLLYDPREGVLHVTVEEENDAGTFQKTYVLNPRGLVDGTTFRAHVERFFHYMWIAALPGETGGLEGGEEPVPVCEGGSCVARRPDGTVCCNACCQKGEAAQCSVTASGCVCSCIPLSE